jgi:hypothetical protein
MKKSFLYFLFLVLTMVLGVSESGAAAWPGPDTFGHNGTATTYSWVEINSTGTNLNLTDDSNSGPQSLGFTFPFYGNNYTDVYVGSNGFVSFGAGSPSLSNQCGLPNSGTPNNLIAAVWDDLLPSGTNNAFFQAFSTCPVGPATACAIVEYSNVSYYSGGGSVTAEVILYPSGHILIQFNNVGQHGSASTTGIENSAGTDGLTYACNTASSISNGSAILFSPPNNLFGTVTYTGSHTSGALLVSAFDGTACGDGTSFDAWPIMITGPGDYPYSIAVPTPGDYYVCAFLDLNNNGAFDPGEPTGQYPGLVSPAAEDAVAELNFSFGDPPTTAIPTMNEWGMIIFLVLAGIGSVYYLRRQDKKES